jgi:multisubunit Na+/H+ antiporter MnhB subunit
MFQAFSMQSGLSFVSALLGGYGVFCVIYSFAAPDLALQALILLGAALGISYFTDR